MSHRTTASAASDDPLAGLLTLQQQQARVPHLFPSLDSIRWFVRRNRAVLQQHHVLLEIAGRPVAPALQDGLTMEILRVCTDGSRNACSMLYGACRRAARALGYQRILTYTLPTEGGASLRAAGFRFDGDAGGPASNWHNRPGRTVQPIGDDLVGGKWRWVA